MNTSENEKTHTKSELQILIGDDEKGTEAQDDAAPLRGAPSSTECA